MGVATVADLEVSLSSKGVVERPSKEGRLIERSVCAADVREEKRWDA